ncbi:MAG: prepilin-type N-terminal cleavage/methylation domain-containing protein [Patescibacteria group bacterium]
MSRRGFTLIEAMTTVAIIGILASIASYTALGARRAARDASRKNDLTNISLAFQARFEDTTCSTKVYPGRTVGQGSWAPVKNISGGNDFCSNFTNYLKVFPLDPQDNVNFPYRFNLSSQEGDLLLSAKHYRLATRLEKPPLQIVQNELNRQSNTWVQSFGGEAYGKTCNQNICYNYFIGN